MPLRPTTHHQRQLAAGRLPQADALRGSACARGYDRAWSQLRDAFIRQNPVCEFCGLPATVIDHIQPIAIAPHRRLDLTNLRPVCTDCHALLTANWKKTGHNEMPQKEER